MHGTVFFHMYSRIFKKRFLYSEYGMAIALRGPFPRLVGCSIYQVLLWKPTPKKNRTIFFVLVEFEWISLFYVFLGVAIPKYQISTWVTWDHPEPRTWNSPGSQRHRRSRSCQEPQALSVVFWGEDLKIRRTIHGKMMECLPDFGIIGSWKRP